MPKRNSLREVRALDKSRKEYPYALSDWWEAGECWGDDANDPESWQYAHDGTLEDCIEALMETISCELDQEMMQDGSMEKLSAEYEDEPAKFLEVLENLHGQKIEDIKKQCLRTGRAQGVSWAINSMLTREQLAWKEKHGFQE